MGRVLIMNATLKHIVATTYKPLLERYLSKKRVYRYAGIRLEIPPEVFHPGFFSSTRLLLDTIRTFPLADKQFLELGAGSGLISIYATMSGAFVTASDINKVAIKWLHVNSVQNRVNPTIIQSDLFETIPLQTFDIIAINPPYYKKQPRTEAEHAWYCGENGEYFLRLFQQLSTYVHPQTEIRMVLCDGCDINLVAKAAADNGFQLRLLLTKKTLIEKNFIYSIVKKDLPQDLKT